MVSFSQLRAKVDATKIKHGSVLDRVDNFLDRARINADDTCYLEKAAPVEDYDSIALGSLRDLLSYSESDKAACNWFRRNGLAW